MGHPDIGVNGQAMFVGGFNQYAPKQPIVRLGGKDGLPVIAPLDDVLRLTGNDIAGKSRHDGSSGGFGEWQSTRKSRKSPPVNFPVIRTMGWAGKGKIA